MRAIRLRAGRERRGVEAIEFAMILPIFFVTIYASFEFGWYMFQRAGVVDAARVACRAAAQLDPTIDDVAGVAAARLADELSRTGISCGGAGACNITITDLSFADPPRVTCDVAVAFRGLTGFLGNSHSSGASVGLGMGTYTWQGNQVLPDWVRGTSVAIYEGEP